MPNCLFSEIYSAKTFDLSVENTFDHFPIMIKLNQSKIPDRAKILKEEYLRQNFLGQNFRMRNMVG